MEFGAGDKGPLGTGWSRRSMAFRGWGRGGGCRKLGDASGLGERGEKQVPLLRFAKGRNDKALILNAIPTKSTD